MNYTQHTAPGVNNVIRTYECEGHGYDIEVTCKNKELDCVAVKKHFTNTFIAIENTEYIL